MTIDALRSARHAEPFQPFLIQTRTGGCIAVSDPGRIAIEPEGTEAVVLGPGSEIHFLTVTDIVAVGALPAPAAARQDNLPDLFA